MVAEANGMSLALVGAALVVAHIVPSAVMATGTAVPVHVASGYPFIAKAPAVVPATNFRDVVVDWASPISCVKRSAARLEINT